MGDTRKLGEQERILHYMHPYGGLMPLQVLHIRGALDGDLVARGLDWLQRQHPMLRAHVRYGGLVFLKKPPFVYRQPYFETEGTTKIPLRILDAPWEDVLTDEMSKPMPSTRSPRLRVTLVRDRADPEMNHLIFCGDHATMDAYTAHLISRQLLEYFADPAVMELKFQVNDRLPPPLEAGFPKKPDSGMKGYEPALRLPRQHVPGAKRATRVIARRLDAAATDALKAAAKANRTTLHGAVTGAFLLAMHQHYGIDRMTCVSSVDLRRLLRPPLPPETYGCYIDVLRTRHDLGPDLWPIARDVSFKLVTALAKDHEAASLLKLPGWEALAAEIWPTMTHNRRIDGLGITTAGDSGLGYRFGNHTLEGVTMGVGIDFVGPSILVLGAERLGALDVTVSYATGALPAADATELVDLALAVLTAAGEMANAS